MGPRIAAWYAFTATATLACLFVAGFYTLQAHLLRQLDYLNTQQFKQLQNLLGPNYASLSASIIDQRIRDATESASHLFYIDMHGPMTNRFFKSHNLQDRTIPDLKGLREFTVNVAGIGDVRVGEFLLPPYDVLIATPMAPIYEVMQSFRNLCLGLTLAMFLLSIAIGFGLSEILLRPVRNIREIANRIRSDNLKERIPVDEVKDEVSELADLLNQMFDRLEASFDQVRRFAAEASHELKTPLSLVRLHAERLLVDGAVDPAHRESLHVQLEEIARINQIIDELLFISRADANAIAIERKDQGPAGFLQVFAQDALALAEHHGRHFSWTHEGEGTVAFEEKRIRQVLLNLLANALNVSPKGGRITLNSTLDQGLWRISVEDEGPGLTSEQRRRMFERFVRFHNVSDMEDRGSGLGLAICRSIVQLHNGRIFAARATNGRGLRMVVEIPTGAALSAA
jgi:two-component system heavy metal sensor histidine kinase CusS